MTDTLQYRIADGVLARVVGDMVALFNPETERLLTLHESGTRIWELLRERTDTGAMIRRLQEEFDGPPDLIEQQVMQFLSQLEAERLVRRVP
jgi:hypothetical protein